MKRASRWTADVKVSWKVFEDAFLEGYHVVFVTNDPSRMPSPGKTIPSAARRRTALREDLSTQVMERSGAMDHMPLSRQEYNVHEHRRWIEKYVNA